MGDASGQYQFHAKVEPDSYTAAFDSDWNKSGDNISKATAAVKIEDVTINKRVGFSFDDRLHMLSSQLINAQELEKKRIAIELHDGICQMLGVIKYKIERVIVGGDATLPQAYAFLQDVVNDVRNAMDEVRNIAMGLRPSILDDFGLLLTIEWFCREFQNTYQGIKIEKSIEISESDIADDRKLSGYRIIQEAMNNIAKYAESTVVYLELSKKTDGVYLKISDNGQGFDVVQISSTTLGFGLRSMRERAELTGGHFTIESIIGGGTVIQVFWPENPDSA